MPETETLTTNDKKMQQDVAKHQIPEQESPPDELDGKKKKWTVLQQSCYYCLRAALCEMMMIQSTRNIGARKSILQWEDMIYRLYYWGLVSVLEVFVLLALKLRSNYRHRVFKCNSYVQTDETGGTFEDYPDLSTIDVFGVNSSGSSNTNTNTNSDGAENSSTDIESRRDTHVDKNYRALMSTRSGVKDEGKERILDVSIGTSTELLNPEKTWYTTNASEKVMYSRIFFPVHETNTASAPILDEISFPSFKEYCKERRAYKNPSTASMATTTGIGTTRLFNEAMTGKRKRTPTQFYCKDAVSSRNERERGKKKSVIQRYQLVKRKPTRSNNQKGYYNQSERVNLLKRVTSPSKNLQDKSFDENPKRYYQYNSSRMASTESSKSAFVDSFDFEANNNSGDDSDATSTTTATISKNSFRWEANFKLLVEYKRQNHTTRVPQHSIEHEHLATWVKTQRYQYSIGRLKQERIALLESIGFEWDPGRDEWMQKYHKLVEYKRKFGSTCVPQEWEGDKSLARWVKNQRHKCKMTNRIELLNAIGFVWKVDDKTPQRMATHAPATPQMVRKDPAKPLYTIGTIVRKKFDDGWFEGYVTDYDPVNKYYRIQYLDGDSEEYDDEDMQHCLKTVGENRVGSRINFRN